jgi:hypothetical protein
VIDGGILLMLLGAAGLIVKPASRAIEHRRPAAIDALIARADAELEQDPLIRGVAALAETYKRA